jgi:hypothetical protein
MALTRRRRELRSDATAAAARTITTAITATSSRLRRTRVRVQLADWLKRRSATDLRESAQTRTPLSAHQRDVAATSRCAVDGIIAMHAATIVTRCCTR